MGKTDRAPLAGRRIVVTRAREQADELIKALERLGAEVLFLPAISFGEAGDPSALDQSIRGLEQFDWLLLTSQNAARFFVKRCHELRGDNLAGLRLPRVAAVGPATAQMAEREGFRVALIAREFRGTALAAELSPRLAGETVLLPRSDHAAEDLPAALRAAGAEVEEVVAYETRATVSWEPRGSEALARGEVDVVTFFSPSAVREVVERVGLESLRRIAKRVAFAAIGPVTADAIRAAGLSVEIQADEATTAALVAAIERHYAQRLSTGVKLL